MRRIFTLVVTAPVCKATNPFVHIKKKIAWSFEWGFVFKGGFTFHENLISHSIIMINYSSVFMDDVSIYLRLFKLAYVPPICYMLYGEYPVSLEDYLARNFCLILWYVDFTLKAAVARINIYGSSSSRYISCKLYVCKRLPST